MNESKNTLMVVCSLPFRKTEDICFTLSVAWEKKKLVRVPNSLTFPGINHLQLSSLSANIRGKHCW